MKLSASQPAQPWVSFPRHINVLIILTQEEDSGFGQGEGLRNRESQSCGVQSKSFLCLRASEPLLAPPLVSSLGPVAPKPPMKAFPIVSVS